MPTSLIKEALELFIGVETLLLPIPWLSPIPWSASLLQQKGLFRFQVPEPPLFKAVNTVFDRLLSPTQVHGG